MNNLLYRDEEITSASEVTSDDSTCSETNLSFGAEESIKKPTNLYCVKEADSHIYSFEDVEFAYNYSSIDLYQIEKGVNDLIFMDFIKHRLPFKPRSGFGFFDKIIIDNLRRQGITQMRPIQIAALQAVFFANPDSQRTPDFMGVSVTGSGKTHAFLIPIIQKCMDISGKRLFNTKPKPLALIFVHSNTLVENVYQKALKMVKKTCLVVRIISGKRPYINDNNFDIGICSIGRFLNHIYPDMPGFKIDLSSVKYVVIDEADKMADTPEFPPLYRTLKEKAVSVLLF
uniref:ATP-dependent RNA helicase n=1 Tax=Panagrolaimus sp. PS1159 TaxID=55785 RepID=A0AC35GXD6_9BILA